MITFLEVKGLLELEQAEKWGEAGELLYDLWYNDKSNATKLCRILSECWYELTEWDCCIQNKNLSFDSFKETLINITQYGLTHFNTNGNFLWMTGYMISLFPYLFYNGEADGLYSEWEERGKDMLLLATQIEPENLISRMLYLGAQGDSDKYSTVKTKLAPYLKDFFPGSTAIEDYFKDILSS
ncbi:MAG: hypothetical protein VB118_04590 [Oscillospiraceae bacterium]|nr:hypothetical protein [Oscillospiraceae bacterium]